MLPGRPVHGVATAGAAGLALPPSAKVGTVSGEIGALPQPVIKKNLNRKRMEADCMGIQWEIGTNLP